MKNYKKIITLLLIVLAIICAFFGCSSIETNSDPTKQIIGQWRLTDDESNSEIRMINDGFPEDNFYIYENGQMTMDGVSVTYSITYDEFTICSFWRGTDYYEYYINGDKLTLTRTNGYHAGYTAYYERVK